MDRISESISQLDLNFQIMRMNLPFVLELIAGLYLIQIINKALGYRLNILGIYPRHLLGLVGIPCSPFLHGSFSHLFFNSLPLVFLLSFVLLSGLPLFYLVTASIIFLGGLGTWLFGRSALHVGASGLMMGYWSFLMMNAYQEGTVTSIVLGLLCIYYLGGLVCNLFPRDPGSSWEAHFFGFLAGVATDYLLPYLEVILRVYGYAGY